MASHAPEGVILGGVQSKNYYHEQLGRGGALPCAKDSVVMQQRYRQEKELLLETASGHSRGRNIATDIALSSGSAELHRKNRDKMQPVVHPQCGPPLLFGTRTNPQICAPLLQTDSSLSFDSPAVPEISPTSFFGFVFVIFCFLSCKSVGLFCMTIFK